MNAEDFEEYKHEKTFLIARKDDILDLINKEFGKSHAMRTSDLLVGLMYETNELGASADKYDVSPKKLCKFLELLIKSLPGYIQCERRFSSEL